MKAIRCKCGCVYPDDMDRCPTCQCETMFNIDHVLSESENYGTKKEKPSEWRPVRTQTIHTAKVNHSKNNNRKTSLISCSICNSSISPLAESCPHCGHPTGVHVCPKCNSTNTKVISGSSKATSIFLWGPFAANKVLSQFQCKDCGHKW